MEKNYAKYLLPALILLGLFYWFQIRPSNVRKECSRFDDRETEYNKINSYKDCLHEKGL